MRPWSDARPGPRAWGGLLGLVLLGPGCGLTTQVRPVPRGTWAAEAAVGGPLVRLGGPLPVPLSTAGVRYGVAEHADVAAHAHLTSLTFGVAGLDVGGAWLALEQVGARPALTLGGRLYGFAQVLPGRATSPRVYLEGAPTVSYLLGGRWLTYASASGLVQFAGGRPLVSLAAAAAFNASFAGAYTSAVRAVPVYAVPFDSPATPLQSSSSPTRPAAGQLTRVT